MTICGRDCDSAIGIIVSAIGFICLIIVYQETILEFNVGLEVGTWMRHLLVNIQMR